MEAGIPNIVGSIAAENRTSMGLFAPSNILLSGAFTGSTEHARRRGSDGSATYNPVQIDFNANNCSEVFGKSTTVQPSAVTMRYYIKY